MKKLFGALLLASLWLGWGPLAHAQAGGQTGIDVRQSDGTQKLIGRGGTDDALPVGGAEFKATSTPTIQNAAYVSGNCMGGFNPLTVARVNGGGVILSNFALRSIGGGTTGIQVYLFDANPSASTCTDKGTFTLNAADVAKIPAGGTFVLTPAAPTGATTTIASATNLALSLIAGGASASGVTTIYYALVSTGTWTPASTSDLRVTANGVQD